MASSEAIARRTGTPGTPVEPESAINVDKSKNGPPPTFECLSSLRVRFMWLGIVTGVVAGMLFGGLNSGLSLLVCFGAVGGFLVGLLGGTIGALVEGVVKFVQSARTNDIKSDIKETWPAAILIVVFTGVLILLISLGCLDFLPSLRTRPAIQLKK
jgi:hypothetical protein